MPRATYGPQLKARTLRLFEALLCFVNYELDECDHLDIKFRWQGEDSATPKLLIKTKLRALEELTKKDNHQGSLTKTQIREALSRMQKFLGILEDNRVQKKGSEEWNFTLSLWSKETAKNLIQFEQNWENKRPEKSKRQEEATNTTSKNLKLERPVPGVEPTKIPQNLPRSGVIQFVGRDKALQELHEQLQQCDRITVCAVAGMGGVGKTELALQYAQSHQQLLTYPGGLCWIQAGEVAVGTQIVSFAREELDLQLPDELDLQKQVAYCWRDWIAGDVLLVLDDVRDYQQVKPYLPPAESRFKVLITTRQQGLGESFKTLRLPVLTQDAAIALLISFVGQERIEQERDQAEHLCKELGYLPLGLELVGRYLYHKPDLSLAQMRQRLDLKHRSLQNPSGEMTAQLGVEAAFELSWQELDEVAQELGCLLSLFALAPIPWSWVEQCLPDREAEVLEDARDYALLNLSLLERFSQSTYQLHQLIREFLRGKLDQLAKADQLKERFCQVMVAAARQIPDTPTRQDITTSTPIIPHLAEAASVYQQWLSDHDLIWLFNGLGHFYIGQGAYEQALPWYELCVSVTRKRLTEDHPDFASSLNNLAALYKLQGRYVEAEPLLLQALELSKCLLGEEHPDLATSLNNLAALYYSQGRYVEAEPLLLQSLELSKCLLGENHPNFAQSLNNLAALYSSQGRYVEAEPLLLQSLELNKCLLGEKHPNFAQSLNNLAQLYKFQGRYVEAELLLLQSLELNKCLLGEKHPNFAQSLSNLAQLYKFQGRYVDAEPLLVQALELRKRLLGAEHPDVAQSLNNLAGFYQSQGCHAKAEPFYLQALELSKRLLGEEHPAVATSLNNLAQLYKFQGRYVEAEPLLVQALELRKRLLGEEHPDFATSLNNLAQLYKFQGRYVEAESLLLQALELRKRLLGEEHPDVAQSLNNLAALYQFRRYVEAEALLLQALELRKRLLGEEHPDVATSLNNLALLYQSQGRYVEAEPLLVQASELRKRLLGEKHPDFATSLNNLAALYYSQGRYIEAEPLLLQALELRQCLLGEKHPDVASNLHNLAALYQSQGRYIEAEPLLLQALEIAEQHLGANHPNTSIIRKNLQFLREQS